jgi:hypothetical protein
MRVLLFAAGVLGIALVFGACERAPGAADPVTSQDVQLLSEQVASLDGPQGFGKNGNKNGFGGGTRGYGRARGSYCR